MFLNATIIVATNWYYKMTFSWEENKDNNEERIGDEIHLISARLAKAQEKVMKRFKSVIIKLMISD